MRCSQVQTAISADLDGEAPPFPREEVTRHLGQCSTCRQFQAAAVHLQRRTRVQPAPAVPDLTGRVLSAIAAEDRDQAKEGMQGLRLGVALIGLLQLGLSLPPLLLGSDAGFPVHAARDLGSFGVALAVGLLVAAGRPERVAGRLPLATALVVCLVASSIVNVSTGHAAPRGELSHAVEVIGLIGLWLLARSPAAPRPARLSPA